MEPHMPRWPPTPRLAFHRRTAATRGGEALANLLELRLRESPMLVLSHTRSLNHHTTRRTRRRHAWPSSDRSRPRIIANLHRRKIPEEPRVCRTGISVVAHPEVRDPPPARLRRAGR